ncbi:MAG: response regulator [Deltaproteobacteria bacterium]|nr:MAG: response regulator [Deltaproteobacteria bacterium]
MSLHAIIIDDARSVRMILKKMMVELGFTVEEAEDGKKALEILVQNGPADVALVDWNMPVMNGFEFIQEVRKQSIYDEMKIMMVTTESELVRMIAALEAGANEYVMKPFTKDIIVEKLTIMGLINNENASAAH